MRCSIPRAWEQRARTAVVSWVSEEIVAEGVRLAMAQAISGPAEDALLKLADRDSESTVKE